MIVQWMLYSIVVGAGFGVAALAGETLSRVNDRAGRWVWILALFASVGLPLFNISFPGMLARSDVLPSVDTGALIVAGAFLPGETGSTGLTPPGVVLLDRLLLVAWLATSLSLVCLVLWTTLKLMRERRSWASATVGGESVLVSKDVGPAVMGIRKHTIVVPRWVLDLSEENRRLVVLHEVEHARAGDLWLLVGGSA